MVLNEFDGGEGGGAPAMLDCKYFNITGPDGERLEFNQIL